MVAVALAVGLEACGAGGSIERLRDPGPDDLAAMRATSLDVMDVWVDDFVTPGPTVEAQAAITAALERRGYPHRFLGIRGQAEWTAVAEETSDHHLADPERTGSEALLIVVTMTTNCETRTRVTPVDREVGTIVDESGEELATVREHGESRTSTTRCVMGAGCRLYLGEDKHLAWGVWAKVPGGTIGQAIERCLAPLPAR